MQSVQSYCNPTPLPQYPKGMWVPLKTSNDYGWIHPAERNDFREAADPCVLYEDEKWYLYVSCGSAFVSSDFITWEHHPIDPYNLEYDPRVIAYRNGYILTASRSPLFYGETPLGPFTELGRVKTPGGKTVTWGAPHLHVEGHRVFAYWGIGGPGIYGAEMDPNDLCQLITEPKVLIRYDATHIWERFGDHNEDPTLSFVEGPWMYKRNDLYYLVYSAPGTEWKSYAFGYYVSHHPLGPFQYGRNNPFVRKTDGMITGTGHGCLADGPNGTTWAFYTCLVRNEHNFERRIGYDEVMFDAEGVPHCQPSETPQPKPGSRTPLSWEPLTHNRPFAHSSCAHRNASGLYALDQCMHTWWLPAAEDVHPSLEVYLKQPFQKQSTFYLRAFRIQWKEMFLDYEAGAPPRPIGYRIDCKFHLSDPNWKTVVDCSDHCEDLLVDYREIPATEAQAVRLVITANPYPGKLGVLDFTVFGDVANATEELAHMEHTDHEEDPHVF